jgi:phosphoenolpyruvate synthase/pyruvate phosphate dikinase
VERGNGEKINHTVARRRVLDRLNIFGLMAYTKNLDKIGESDRPLVGPMAVTLARLLKKGAPVPPGFVISANAYEKFCLDNKLDVLIQETVGAADFFKKKNFKIKSAAIREAIMASPMPKKAWRPIRGAVGRLGVFNVAA